MSALRSQDYQSWRSRDADRDLVPRFSGMSLGDLMKVVLVRIVVYGSAFLSFKQLSSVSMSSPIFFANTWVWP